MKYTVITLPQSEREFGEQYAYIAERSRSGAESWAYTFYRALKKLESHADTYAAAPENEQHPEDIRQVVFKTRSGLSYRGLFTIRGNAVYLLHVRGPGQDVMSPEEIELPR